MKDNCDKMNQEDKIKKLKARRKLYYQKNKEVIKKQTKDRYWKKQDEIIRYRKKWYQENKDRILREWAEKQKELRRQSNCLRIEKRTTIITFT